MSVNQERLLQDIHCLPPVARQEAIDFIAFLKARHSPYAAPETVGGASAMGEEPFVGMWKDRSHITDPGTIRDDTAKIMKFAGCWRDLTDGEFAGFSQEIAARRARAFSGRIDRETIID